MELTDEVIWGTLPDGIYLATREDGVVQFDPTVTRLGEVVPLVDAPSVDTEDHGNMAFTLVLGVVRKHASPAASREFLIAHGKAIAALKASSTPRPLTLRYYGAGVSEYTIPGALITTFPGQQLGLSSHITYTISGGAPQ
ncbi:hypothetical protein BH09VER1_BH09VER1_28370 [soil metagenome]